MYYIVRLCYRKANFQFTIGLWLFKENLSLNMLSQFTTLTDYFYYAIETKQWKFKLYYYLYNSVSKVLRNTILLKLCKVKPLQFCL